MRTIHKIGRLLGILWLSGSISSAQEIEAPEGVPKKKEMPYLDIQIVPVGNVPLARFGRNKNAKPSSLPVRIKTRSPGSSEEDKEAPSQSGSSSPTSQFSVLVRPDDERPPTRFYVKSEGHYLVINCHQNSIGTPIRIPLTSAEVVFYTMKRKLDGTESYKRAFVHTVKPNQKRVLFTVSKPLKEKKWTRAKVKTYDLSPVNLSKISALLINSSAERYIGGEVNESAFALAPSKSKAIRSGSLDALKFKLAASLNKKTWSKTQKLSLPPLKDETHIMLAYAVSTQESSRGFKVMRGKLHPDEFRIPSKHKPRR